MTFAHVLRALAGHTASGFTFVGPDLEGRFLTFDQVAAEARRRAAHLLARGLRRGDHLGVIIPEAEDFVLCFLGALYAGIVPVPLYPPLALGRLDAYIETTALMLRAANVRMLLTTGQVKTVLWSLADRIATLEDFIYAESLRGPADPGHDPDPDAIGADDVAFLQFTSGSTAAPKGVKVTHRSLLANCHVIMAHLLKVNEHDTGVSWLPLYHDMGLIGFVLAPISTRHSVVFIPTLEFVGRPAIWLETIHRYRGSVTFAPNFAYSLVTRTTPSVEGLDLSCVRVFGCGAEPIHLETMRAFQAHFAPAGLRPTAVVPCYGMAEATLAMTFTEAGVPLSIDRIDGGTYHGDGRAVPAGESAPTLDLVSCGRPAPGHRVTIVGEDGRALPERVVGEILFEGPSVTAGYYQDDTATAATFTNAGLRSGDLGYLANGDLYITGRKKDVLIVNGRNYDPQTIELEVAAVAGVRKGNIVAFSRPGTATEQIVVAAETRMVDRDGLAKAIRKRVRDNLSLHVADVVLLAPATLPKTSSGKLQRMRARQQYLEGTLGAEGVRALGARGNGVILAKHLARSLVNQLRHRVRKEWALLRGRGQSPR